MSQELIFKESNIAAYDEFRSQLTALQTGNEKAVFDYRDPKGNKEARSHVYKLRQTKAAIEKVRKQEKEVYLLKGRQVDIEAKEISAIVEQMIEVHETPLKEIERDEEERKAKHQSAINEINLRLECRDLDSVELKKNIEFIESIKLGDHWEEFEQDAARAKDSALSALRECLVLREKYEAEQAELAKLRQEAAEREQKEREERIAREAAEAARKKAEQEAEIERRRIQDEADRKARDQQLEIERAQREKAEQEAAALRREQEHAQALAKAEQDRLAALAKAEADKKAAIEAEQLRQKQEADRLQAEEEKRARNKAHAKKINNEILSDMVAAGCSEDCAKAIISAIVKGEVRHTQINY